MRGDGRGIGRVARRAGGIVKAEMTFVPFPSEGVRLSPIVQLKLSALRDRMNVMPT